MVEEQLRNIWPLRLSQLSQSEDTKLSTGWIKSRWLTDACKAWLNLLMESTTAKKHFHLCVHSQQLSAAGMESYWLHILKACA